MTKEDLEKSEFRVKRMIKRGLGRTTLNEVDKELNSGTVSTRIQFFVLINLKLSS